MTPAADPWAAFVDQPAPAAPPAPAAAGGPVTYDNGRGISVTVGGPADDAGWTDTQSPAANDQWADFDPIAPTQPVVTPITHVSQLPKTKAMEAALAADAARPETARDPGSLNLISNFAFGRGPEVDAGATYLDTALGNAVKRLTGQPIAYGASDAYDATLAADRDRLATFQKDHPVQAGASAIAGAGVNPVNMLGGALIGRAFAGGGAAGLGRAAALSAGMGAGEGAVYGSADQQDPLGSAGKGALYGGVAGALAVPLGAAAGGVIRGAVNGGRRFAAGPLASLGSAVGDITPEQMQAAQALRIDMRNRGVDVSLPEAVQQVTNGATSLGRSLRVLEGTRQGGEILSPYFANRAGQVRGAVTDFADQVADPTELPSAIGPRAQQAAQGGLDEVRTNINAAAQPHYDAMAGKVVPATGAGTYANASGATRYVAGPGQSLPEHAYAGLAKNHAYQEALSQVRGDRLLNAQIAQLPDNDVSVVNEVVKQLDRNAIAAKQTATNPGGNNYKASLYQNARELADKIATLHSPQWRAARDTVQAGRQWLLEPLEAGPVGQIARTDSVPGQVSALYPSKPLAGAASETETAMRVLNNQHPGVGADLTRQHLLTALDSSRPVTQQGPNPYIGANFANNVAGTPEQEAALMSGVRNSSPRGDVLGEDLRNLLEGLRATGRREPAGSKTAYNADDIAQMRVTGAGKALRRALDPFEWGAGVADLIDRANWRRNVEGLSRYYTADPSQTVDILSAARAAAPGQVQLRLPLLPYQTAGLPMLPRTNSPPQR